jgi:hypothetical protein
MTCETLIDQGDSRSYCIAVRLGSHRVKRDTKGPSLSLEGGLGFFMPPRSKSNPRGTARWGESILKRKRNGGRSPTFCSHPIRAQGHALGCGSWRGISRPVYSPALRPRRDANDR